MVLQSTQAITTWMHAMLSAVTTWPPPIPQSPEHQCQRAREVAHVPRIHLPPDPPCLAQKLLQNQSTSAISSPNLQQRVSLCLFKQLPAAGEKVTCSILLRQQPPSPTCSLIALPRLWGNLEASSSPRAESTLQHSHQLSYLVLAWKNWGDKKSKCGKVNCAPFIDRAGEGKWSPGCLLASHCTRSTSPLSRMLSWHKSLGWDAAISSSHFHLRVLRAQKEHKGAGCATAGFSHAQRFQSFSMQSCHCRETTVGGGQQVPGLSPTCRPRREWQEEGAGGRCACVGTTAGTAGLSWHHPPAYRKSGRKAENSNRSCDSEAARRGEGAEVLCIQQKYNKGKEKRERARVSRGPWLPLGSPGAAERDELPDMKARWGGWCRTVNRDSHPQNLNDPEHFVGIPHAACHCSHPACWADLLSQRCCKPKPTLPPSASRHWTPLPKPPACSAPRQAPAQGSERTPLMLGCRREVGGENPLW